MTHTQKKGAPSTIAYYYTPVYMCTYVQYVQLVNHERTAGMAFHCIGRHGGTFGSCCFFWFVTCAVLGLHRAVGCVWNCMYM